MRFTTLRPDVVIFAKEVKKIITVELILPREEGHEEAAERKTSKYEQLVKSSTLSFSQGRW